MLLTALIMGLAGSLHCAGMCSPLAMAVSNLNSAAITNRIFYNVGRITMYCILGAMVATFGYIFPISKFQSLLSIALGLILIAMAACGMTGVRIPFLTRALTGFTARVKTLYAAYLGRKNRSVIFLLGSLNGILPCGLTFLALSFCLTLSTPVEGFVYMFLFGIGTLPVMLGFVSIVGLIRNKMNWNIKYVTTGLMVMSGILLIARVFLVHAAENHNHEINLIDTVICR